MKTKYNLLKRGSIEFMTCITLNGYKRAVISNSKFINLYKTSLRKTICNSF